MSQLVFINIINMCQFTTCFNHTHHTYNFVSYRHINCKCR